MSPMARPVMVGKRRDVCCGEGRCICIASGALEEGSPHPLANAAQRARVVAEARTWLGTPYHHAADVKGHGVDCAMLLVRVYCDLGLVKPFDPRPYTRDWFLHRREEKYLGHLFDRAHEVREPELGDTIVFRIGRCYAHAGIVSRTKPFAIIHAFAAARAVIEDFVGAGELQEKLKTAKFASFWSGNGLPPSQ